MRDHAVGRHIPTNRGVSPVVGVVMMVAITVILAAVIGSFVFTMGTNQEPPPATRISIDVSNGNLRIGHDSGDAVSKESVRVVIDGTPVESSALLGAGPDERYTAGEPIYETDAPESATVAVVWESRTSDRSVTLTETTVR